MCYLETRREGLLSQKQGEICHSVEKIVGEDLEIDRDFQVFLDIMPLVLR
jgi:hypothetical protein